MPARIGVHQRIVVDIRIPIQPLHPARYNRIRLGESPQRGVVPAGVVIIQPNAALEALTRVLVISGRVTLLITGVTENKCRRMNDECRMMGGNGHSAFYTLSFRLGRQKDEWHERLCLFCILHSEFARRGHRGGGDSEAG